MMLAEIIDTQSEKPAKFRCSLTYSERFVRRKRLSTDCGIHFLLNLEHTTNLNNGDHIILSDKRHIEVCAKAENLASIAGKNLSELAWHIGNRHTPCQVDVDKLLIQKDHVIEDMIKRLGGKVTYVFKVFTPLGGAYGFGRTHSHSH